MTLRIAGTLCLLSAALAFAQAPISKVDVKLKVAGGTNTAVRVWLTGGAGLPELNEFAMTDEAGEATLYTRRSSYMFVAARRRDCDLKIWGHKKNAGLGGVNQVFQRSRMDLLQLGASVTADPVELTKKTPGKARFCFVAEDSLMLRRTGAPTNQLRCGKVFVTGDWNNFNTLTTDADPEHGAQELFDDGGLTSGSTDDQIGDGVFTRMLDLPPGEHTYVFLVNGISNMSLSFMSDPYEEGRRTATARHAWKQTPTDPGHEGEASFPASVITVTGQ